MKISPFYYIFKFLKRNFYIFLKIPKLSIFKITTTTLNKLISIYFCNNKILIYVIFNNFIYSDILKELKEEHKIVILFRLKNKEKYYLILCISG